MNNRILKPDYQDLADDFELAYIDIGCTCFNNPPCSYCTDAGNPINLEYDDDAWEPEIYNMQLELELQRPIKSINIDITEADYND